MSLTRIEAEQIPNCYFLGKKLARLRIYRNRKISPDPIGRQKYLISPKGWELLEEYPCPIENGTLHIPTIELEPTYTDANGLPTVLYQAVVVDEKGAERCLLLSLFSLMKGHEKVIDGYDETGAKTSITLVNIKIEKTTEFMPFVSTDDQTRYKPKPGVRLEFVKEIKCVKQSNSLTMPPNIIEFEPDADGNPSVIYILLEEIKKGGLTYVATMHFERDELNPSNWHVILYNDLGPQQITVEKDPIADSGYLGKSAILRIYRSKRFSPDPTDENKYISEPGSDEYVKDVSCSIKDDTLYIPSFPLDIETDAEGKPTVIYTAMLVDENGVERGALFSDTAFENSGSKKSPSVVEIANPPNPKRNPLKVYRSGDFHYYLNEDRNKAYEPKPGSLEYVMDISYEIKDDALVIHQWTIDIDDKDIKQNEDDTPNMIYRGIIIDRGTERIAFTGYIAGVPPRLITYKSNQSKVIVTLFKRSPFRT
jgi:hypothetical protein